MDKITKIIACEIKELDDESRSFMAVASTEDIDRDGDRIMSSGWDLGNFLKNPVVPWSHRYGDPPVAKATHIAVQDGRLMFKTQFATAEEYGFADTIYKLYRGGFLRSFSVGFAPKRRELVEREKGIRGWDYIEQELWEISACTVPSNPNALVAAKAEGLITDEDIASLEASEMGDKIPALESRLAGIEKKIDDLLDHLFKPGNPFFKPENLNRETEIVNPEPITPEPPGEKEISEIARMLAIAIAERINTAVDNRIQYHKGIV